MISHPIFGDVMASDLQRKAKREAEARQLRELLEQRWRQPGVTNARRAARYAAPMSLGSTWGYPNDLYGE